MYDGSSVVVDTGITMINQEQLANLLGRILAANKGDRIYGYVRKNGCPVLGAQAKSFIEKVLAYVTENPQADFQVTEFGKVLRLAIMVGGEQYNLTIHCWRD